MIRITTTFWKCLESGHLKTGAERAERSEAGEVPPHYMHRDLHAHHEHENEGLIDCPVGTVISSKPLVHEHEKERITF